MKQILDAVRHPGDVVRKPAGWQSPGEEMIGIEQGNGQTLWLTRQEAGAAGYREVPSPLGGRTVQFALCRGISGEWVYPPLKQPNETLEQMLERNAEGRRSAKALCPKKRGNGQDRRWEE